MKSTQTEILSEILEEINKDNKIKITIAGAGVAGIFSALEIMRELRDAQIKIIEKKQKILSGTSANTPGRMGLGYHYKDFETAVNYMKNTIIFMKKYRDCFIEDEGKPNLVNGRYFVLKDSIIDPQDLISTYDKLSLEFEKLWMADPEIQKLFPQTCHLHRIIPPAEYSQYVDPKIVHLAIETREKLLDWDKFEKKVLSELDHYIKSGNVEILTSVEVVGVSYNEDSSFQIELETKTAEGKIRNFQNADFFINSTWHNIESLNKKFNITNLEPWTSRMKLLAEVKLPESLSNAHSMFFCLGPFAMFSNMGLKKDKDYSVGRITFAKVTNHSHYPSTEMPDFYHRFLDGELNDKDLEYLDEKGRQIIKGVAKYIPQMADAELIKVFSGIIKSVGDVDIFNPNSKFHERREFGTNEELLGFYVNASIKLFYCVHNAKKISEMFKKSIVSIIIIDHLLKNIDKNLHLPDLEKKNMMIYLRVYIKKYLFDQFSTLSVNLIEETFKKENLTSEESYGLVSREQKKLLDDFFDELFIDSTSLSKKLRLLDDDGIKNEKNRLKIFYDNLLDSIIKKSKILAEVKDLKPILTERRYQKNQGVREKSIRELIVGSTFLDKSRERSLNYLFDFGSDFKDPEKFRDLFQGLVLRLGEQIKSRKMDAIDKIGEKEEVATSDVLKFYKEFLLRKLPQVSFEYKEKGKIVVDQSDDRLINVIFDKQSCIEALELILNIEDNDIKIFLLNSFKLFLEEFAKTHQDQAKKTSELQQTKKYLEFSKNCQDELVESVTKIALDDKINILEFTNLLTIGIVSHANTLLSANPDYSLDQEEIKKRDFYNFKINNYLEIFDSQFDEDYFVALSKLSFKTYLEISPYFKDKILTYENSDKTLNLEISCKLFEIAFEKKTKGKIIEFFEELNSFVTQNSLNQTNDFFGFQEDDNEASCSNILKSLLDNQDLRALIESYPDIDVKVLEETISACFNNITLALEFRKAISVDQNFKSDDYLLESKTHEKYNGSEGDELGDASPGNVGLSSSPSSNISSDTTVYGRSESADQFSRAPSINSTSSRNSRNHSPDRRTDFDNAGFSFKQSDDTNSDSSANSRDQSPDRRMDSQQSDDTPRSDTLLTEFDRLTKLSSKSIRNNI